MGGGGGLGKADQDCVYPVFYDFYPISAGG